MPIKLKKIVRKLSPAPLNARRRERYHRDPTYRDKKREEALRGYRRVAKVELSSCLHSLKFLDKLATNQRVVLPDGTEQNFPVFTVPQAAAALQTFYQTVWRWIRRGQVPYPVLNTKHKQEAAYHLREVRVLIEEIGKHQEKVTYYRRDHREVRERIFGRIGKVRLQLNLQEEE